MSEERNYYLVKDGRPVEDSPYVRQQIVALMKERNETGLVLVGYEEQATSVGVPVEALQTVENFVSAGFDVGQAGACTLPQLSFMAKNLGASACYVDDSVCYLDRGGGYLDGKMELKRIEKKPRGKLMRFEVQREYIRHLRKEIAADRLHNIALAVGGLNPKLLSLLAQVIPLKGLWRVRSEASPSLSQVAESVIRSRADVGIKLNSAGTKAEFVDENGTTVTTEEAAALIARYLKEQGSLNGKVARRWNVSRFFDRVMEKTGITVEENADFLVGDEIVFRPHLSIGDGLWLGLIICEIVAVGERPLSELIKEMHKVVLKRESKQLIASEGQLDRFLRKLTGKALLARDRGELQVEGDIISWLKNSQQKYEVFLDGDRSRLHFWLEQFPPDTL